MVENLDTLLKTEEQTTVVEQASDDIFKNSKIKIKNICRALCLPSKRYNPQKTIESLEDYLSETTTRKRILYSEISSFVFGLRPEQQGNFATNIESLLGYSAIEENAVDEEHYKIIVKIYDHFQLALQQKSLSTSATEIATALLVDSMSEAEKKITARVTRAAKIDTKKIEKQYITILGIFASVVLSFVGGITFSSSVLQNIQSASIYRLLIVIDLLAIVLINTIYVLVKFICQINDKDIKLFKMKWVNVALIGVAVLIVLAWIIDARALAEFLKRGFPWIV